MNISITNDQAKFVDNLVVQYDFGNRSELFRGLLRLVQGQPQLIVQSSTLPFRSPPTHSRSQALKALKDTGLYTKEFLKDIKIGLKEDVYFSEE